MEFRFDSSGTVSTGVVVLSGRLDLLAANDLKDRIRGIVGDGWRNLVVDLAEVGYIDSSGLGALISGMNAARSAGGDFRIARPALQVRHVLKASQLDRVLAPYVSVEDALQEYVQDPWLDS